MSKSLPFELKNEFMSNNLVLFVGAGLVKNYLKAMPSWSQLLAAVFQRLSNETDSVFGYCDRKVSENGHQIIPPDEYLRLAQKFEPVRLRANKSLPVGEALQAIHKLVDEEIRSRYDRTAARKAIKGKHFANAANLPLQTWITTNFDTFIEDTVFQSDFEQGYDPVLSRPVKNADFSRPQGEKTLLKIHGTVGAENPDQSIVITEEDYHRFLRTDRYLTSKLYTLFCERTVVFLGYSLSDPNIQFIYNEVLFDHKRQADGNSFAQVRPAFFVSREGIPQHQKDYFTHKQIRYLENWPIEDFFGALTEAHEQALRLRKDLVGEIDTSFLEYYGGLTSANPGVSRSSDWIERTIFLLRLAATNPDKSVLEERMLVLSCIS